MTSVGPGYTSETTGSEELKYRSSTTLENRYCKFRRENTEVFLLKEQIKVEKILFSNTPNVRLKRFPYQLFD